MPSWSNLLDTIHLTGSVDNYRQHAIADLAGYRDRNLVCYYSGWLQRPQISDVAVSDNDVNGFMNALSGMDRARGLDLVLHTPGGEIAATEAIVEYLYDFFNGDICAIVPQLSMSAGTMMTCACREVIMGRQSSLGPTDPQLRGVAAGGVIEEFKQAVADVEANPAAGVIWAQIVSQYTPTFLGDCQKAVDMSRDMVGKWLKRGMLADDEQKEDAAERILNMLCDHSSSAMHNRHFSHNALRDLGVRVSLMEDDNELQDKILTLHHLYMITFQQTPAVKIVEGSGGNSWILHGNQA